jgi:hypothetical protein
MAAVRAGWVCGRVLQLLGALQHRRLECVCVCVCVLHALRRQTQCMQRSTAPRTRAPPHHRHIEQTPCTCTCSGELEQPEFMRIMTSTLSRLADKKAAQGEAGNQVRLLLVWCGPARVCVRVFAGMCAVWLRAWVCAPGTQQQQRPLMPAHLPPPFKHTHTGPVCAAGDGIPPQAHHGGAHLGGQGGAGTGACLDARLCVSTQPEH